MASCEYCWERSGSGQGSAFDYKATLRQAEMDGSACCERDADGELTENARRLRAGQFWDDATKTDRRMTTPRAVSDSPTPEPRG